MLSRACVPGVCYAKHYSRSVASGAREDRGYDSPALLLTMVERGRLVLEKPDSNNRCFLHSATPHHFELFELYGLNSYHVEKLSM